MKKYIFILLSVFMFFCINMNIEAKEYDCVLEGLDPQHTYWWDTKRFLIHFDTSYRTLRGRWYDTVDEINAIGDLGIDRKYDSGYFIDYFDEKCPSRAKICKYTWGPENTYVIIFQDYLTVKLDREWYLYQKHGDPGELFDNWYELFESKEKCIDAHGDADCGWFLSLNTVKRDKTVECGTFIYSDDSTEDVSDKTFQCDFYYNKVEEMKPLVDQYNKCKDGLCNVSSIVSEYNKKRDELKTFCKSYLSIMSVGDSCIDICLNLSKNLEADKAIIEDNKVDIKCGMSENIVSMIYNVFKWLRYIAPVLVIILSILDFIKAIAAQSDDEMKKAQGKFIKRLIVAALLFLVPLIINFALKTFGMYHSGCDITDLF